VSAEFRKCISFGNAVRVPSHDVLTLLSPDAPLMGYHLFRAHHAVFLPASEQQKNGPATRQAHMVQKSVQLD
jgi:hypothetical protein